MPRKPGRGRDSRTLSADRLMNLWDDLLVVGRPFRNDAERRSVYEANRDRVIESFVYQSVEWPRFGERPESFWAYDFPAEQSRQFGRDSRERQFQFLESKNLLLPGEAEVSMAQTKRLQDIENGKNAPEPAETGQEMGETV
jgi:hypothetical protein